MLAKRLAVKSAYRMTYLVLCVE